MKRHSTDLTSLVFGVVFLGVAGWWLVGQYVTIHVPHLGWIAAAVLIALGLLGLAGSLRGERPATAPATAPTSGPTVEMAPVPPAAATFGEAPRSSEPEPAPEDGPRDAIGKDQDGGTDFR